MKKLILILSAVFCGYCANAQFTVFQEDFDSLSVLLTNGWSINNLSSPVGTDTWKQEDGALSVDAFSGAPTASAQVNYESVDNLGTISNWLISPQMSLYNGDTVSFYTVSYNSHGFPDRLECRLNEQGTTNVGNTASSVGDFTDTIVIVNPNQDTISYPSFQVQGDTWTKFTGVVSGLPNGGAYCRIAFRYHITDAGANGTRGSTIGLDALRIMSTANSMGTENMSQMNVAVYPNPVADILTIQLGQKMNAVLRLTDMKGRVLFSQPVNAEISTLNVSLLSAGNYVVQVMDETSQQYFSQVIVVQ